MARSDLATELERRFGEDAIYWPDFEWRDGVLVGLHVDRLEVGRAVVEHPDGAHLERLALFDGEPFYGEPWTASDEPLAPLDELLPRLPHLTRAHANAKLVKLAAHERLEMLTVVANALPRPAAFPALRQLRLGIAETVSVDALDAFLHACPALTTLVLHGAGFANIELGAIEYPSGLELTFEPPLERARAHALVASPGTLERLSRLELPSKPIADRPALLALEKAVPLTRYRVHLSLADRWREVEAACYGPIDPALRVWDWRTGEEGRSSGWVLFVPTLGHGPRAAELLRDADGAAIYADLLEESGELDRARYVRAVGLPFVPRTLPEGMAILACASRRISPPWVRMTPPNSSEPVIDPLRPDDFDEYVTMFSDDEHPLAPAPERTVEVSVFTDQVRWMIEMMREQPPATLRENEVLVRDDVLTFTPPIGTVRHVIALRDAWNNKFIAAETELGYALFIWGTTA
ncbi:MAG: hypothetical protein QM831_38615 [Kofleriaceae bacterium]